MIYGAKTVASSNKIGKAKNLNVDHPEVFVRTHKGLYLQNSLTKKIVIIDNQITIEIVPLERVLSKKYLKRCLSVIFIFFCKNKQKKSIAIFFM